MARNEQIKRVNDADVELLAHVQQEQHRRQFTDGVDIHIEGLSQMNGEREANGRIKIPQWVVYAIVALGSWGISAFVSYSAQSSATNARITVLEMQYQQMRSDLVEVKADVKTLLRRP